MSVLWANDMGGGGGVQPWAMWRSFRQLSVPGVHPDRLLIQCSSFRFRSLLNPLRRAGPITGRRGGGVALEGAWVLESDRPGF